MTARRAGDGRAVESLDKLKTADALPPEMEALNQLLRAQADVKRREVMRQQAGSGGGQNRRSKTSRTCSTRSCARQQQTNYETPKTTEQREAGDSAARRGQGAGAPAGRAAADASRSWRGAAIR